jgi:hypothetical protein
LVAHDIRCLGRISHQIALRGPSRGSIEFPHVRSCEKQEPVRVPDCETILEKRQKINERQMIDQEQYQVVVAGMASCPSCMVLVSHVNLNKVRLNHALHIFIYACSTDFEWDFLCVMVMLELVLTRI